MLDCLAIGHGVNSGGRILHVLSPTAPSTEIGEDGRG